MTKKIKWSDLNLDVVREKVAKHHSEICPSEFGPDIYIDEMRSQFDGEIFCTEHNWRPQPYVTIDLYVECQNCNKAGYTTLRLDNDILK